MRCFRNLVLTTLVLGLGSAVASSQSLAEVAKKEKERRKNSADSKRTITDRELASSFSGLPPASSTVQTPASGDGTRASTAAAEGEGGETPAQDEKKTPEYWQNRMKGSKEKIAKLEQQLQSEDWGGGQKVGVDPRGANNLGTRQQAEQQVSDGGRRKHQGKGGEGLHQGLPGEIAPGQEEPQDDPRRQDQEGRPRGHFQADEQSHQRVGGHDGPSGTMNPKSWKTLRPREPVRHSARRRAFARSGRSFRAASA